MDYQKIQAYFFLGLLVGIFVLVFFIFRPFIGPLLLGATFALIFEPLYRRILSFFSSQESLAALVTITLVLVLVLVPLVFLGSRVLSEARALYVSLTNGAAGLDLTRNLANFLEEWIRRVSPFDVNLSREMLSANINQYLEQVATWLIENLFAIFSSVAKVAFSLVLSLFALYYLLKDGRKFVKSVIALSPLADHYDKEIFEKLSTVINSVVKGTLVVAIVQGILAGIGFAAFGVPRPALLGSVTAVAALIPVAGTALVTLPAVLYLLAVGKAAAALGLLVWAVLLVGAVDNFLRPKLIERGVRLHPFLILLSVLGGTRLFGPAGFLIGPLLLSLLFALLDIYQKEFRTYIGRAS